LGRRVRCDGTLVRGFPELQPSGEDLGHGGVARVGHLLAEPVAEGRQALTIAFEDAGDRLLAVELDQDPQPELVRPGGTGRRGAAELIARARDRLEVVLDRCLEQCGLAGKVPIHRTAPRDQPHALLDVPHPHTVKAALGEQREPGVAQTCRRATALTCCNRLIIVRNHWITLAKGVGMERKVLDLPGGRMEYVDTGGTGPALVLLHGVLMDELLWTPVISHLGPQVRCVVPILPLGAHSTPLGPEADVRPVAVARLLGNFIDALDLHHAVLVGSDTGGALAQLLVAERPEVVAGLVLVSCDAYDNFPPGLPGATMALAARLPGGLRMAVGSMRVRSLRRLPMTFGPMTARPIDDETFNRWLAAFAGDRGVRRDLRAFMRGVTRQQLAAAAVRLGDFRGASLVVWAADDTVMPPAHADRLAADLGGAPVKRVPDSRTLVPLDQPERLASLLLAQLASVSSKAGAQDGEAEERPPAATL
jgi:pimeloyl-ACP methyl ester carboxylesterase